MNRGILIEARTVLDDPVAQLVLDHGDDPAEVLHDLGYDIVGVTAAFTPAGDDGAVLRLRVAPAAGDGPARPTRMPPGPGAEVVPAGAEVHRAQRLAAYAVVVRDQAVLLAELSDKVGFGRGTWTLPGGGVDPGEDPGTGLRREVWEETGQHLGEIELLDLATMHWTGRAPSGRWEDYQVVRLIYVASIPEPGELIVHDADGTTAAAAGIPLADLARLDRARLLQDERFTGWLAAAARANGGCDGSGDDV